MIYVLLPAYNEGSILRSLLEELAMNLTSLDHRFIVIDDGSKDHTAQAAEEMQKSLPLDIIYHKVNMGLGSSLRDALLYIRDKIRDHDIIITLDADGTHRPEYLSALTSRCTKMTPLVIASRYAKGGGEIGVPNARSLFSRCANRLMQALFPIPRINDYTSGYRAYAGSLILTGFSAYGENLVSEKGFTCMAELLIKLSFIENNFCEIPFILRYDIKQGESKMPVFRTIMRYFFLWIYLKRTKRLMKKE